MFSPLCGLGFQLAKLNLGKIFSGFQSVQSINNNNDKISAAIENTISRNGAAPNNMVAELDLGGNRVINVGAPVDDNDAVRLIDLSGLSGGLGGGDSTAWVDITGKPSTFPPSGHSHVSSAITDLVEVVQDIVGAMVVPGANVSTNYNDANGTLTIGSTGGSGGSITQNITNGDTTSSPSGDAVFDALALKSNVGHNHPTTEIVSFTESVQDIVGAMLTAGTNVSLNYDDPTGVLTINAAGGGGGGTVVDSIADGDTVNAPSRNAVFDALALKSATSHTHTSTAITDFTEAVQDVMGATVVAGSGITATYNDGAGTLTLSAAGGGGGTANAPNFIDVYGGVGNGSTNNDTALANAEAGAFNEIWLPEGKFLITAARTSLKKKYVGPGKLFYTTLQPRTLQNASAYTTKVTATLPTGSEYGLDEDLKFSDYDYRVIAPGDTRRNFERYRGGAYSQYFWAPAAPQMSLFQVQSGWSGFSATLAGGASAGATSCTINGDASDWTSKGVGAGVKLGFTASTSMDGIPGDVVTISSISGSTVNFSPALVNSYTAGSVVSHGYRTMNTHSLKVVEHTGGGDAYAFTARMINSYKLLDSQTAFENGATVGIIGGDVTLTENGTYATGWECQYIDTGKDVCIGNSVNSYVRTNNGGARGVFWIHDLAKMDGGASADAYGLKPLDGVYVFAGQSRVGLDFTRAAFNVAAIALPLNQKIAFNAAITSPGASNGNGWVATTTNNMWMHGSADGVGPYIEMHNNGYRIRLRQDGSASFNGNWNTAGNMAAQGSISSLSGRIELGSGIFFQWNGSNLLFTKNGGASYTTLV